MLPSHARTLAQARSHVAALADQAQSHDASSGYERVLLELDRLHNDESPASCTEGLPDDGEVLYAVAASAIEELGTHGIDALDIELVLAMLDEARSLDRS